MVEHVTEIRPYRLGSITGRSSRTSRLHTSVIGPRWRWKRMTSRRNANSRETFPAAEESVDRAGFDPSTSSSISSTTGK